MSCLKGGRHVHARGDRKSHVSLKCCWKMKVLLLICAKVSRCWLTMNLVIMIELQGSNSLNRLLGQWWMSV